jgi:hypothetical protein
MFIVVRQGIGPWKERRGARFDFSPRNMRCNIMVRAERTVSIGIKIGFIISLAWNGAY